ncbi:ABC transporter permease [Planctomycetota bacterium]
MIPRLLALVEIEITKLLRQGFFYSTFATVVLATALSIWGAWRQFDPANTVEIFNGQTCFLQAASRGLFVGAFLVLIWTALTVSQESGQGVYRIVLAKPVARMEFFFAKYCASAIFLLLVSWLAIILAYSLSGMLFGYGDIMDYGTSPPILKMAQADAARLMVRGILLSLPGMLALAAFGLFCSSVTDNSGIAVGAALGGYMILELLRGMFPELKSYMFASYLPPLTFVENPPLAPMLLAIDSTKGFSSPWDAGMINMSVFCPLIFVIVIIPLSAIIFYRRDILT